MWELRRKRRRGSKEFVEAGVDRENSSVRSSSTRAHTTRKEDSRSQDKIYEAREGCEERG